MKSFVIRATNRKTGAHVYSRTNNVKQRLEMLRYNILSINGNGAAVFDRFVPFIGCDPFNEDDVTFEFFKQIDYKEQA